MRFRFASSSSMGYVDTQCISSKGHFFFVKISTARSMSRVVLIPVEMNVCRPSEATSLRSSGLTIIAETNPDAHSAGVGFFVRTGARDEQSGLMGVSHFLEHMMFKGTEDLSAEEVGDAHHLAGLVAGAGADEEAGRRGVGVGIDLGDDGQAVGERVLAEVDGHGGV